MLLRIKNKEDDVSSEDLPSLDDDTESEEIFHY